MARSASALFAANVRAIAREWDQDWPCDQGLVKKIIQNADDRTTTNDSESANGGENVTAWATPRKLIVDLQALKARHEDAHKGFRFFRALSLIVALPGALPRLSHSRVGAF